MGTVTLGVSIAVPEPYGSQLQELRAGFGDAAAHGIPTHVTLVPPTEVEADRLPQVRAHLAEVAAACRSFRMRLAGTGTFRPLSPVVYVQVVEGAPGCTRLQGQVRAPEGPLSRELAFPYHPHVTVAHGISEEAMDLAFTALAEYAADWVCDSFALYEQGSDGVWRKLREYPFGTGPTGVPAQLSCPVDAAADAAEATVRPA
ncbi:MULTISPECIES: 2'-5' RNA ligase family protein [unclassified Streptomyces]|uniref:2'-5' RNA ligase family protein n=1 Tax=unclassified Streptomyces TaxID=2593676 RepID=UPI001BE5925B|nr:MULTISPECIES: 2'-5' RNA ligase family protein [unclassified Streptomyces]MBT2402359.1 2'-5' RNA ligase family protein [Streptomyces sp. ISL-21]MBT2607691.1 2'-5' RNA ligase family protein [Streptomyces sp. ISL-87]